MRTPPSIRYAFAALWLLAFGLSAAILAPTLAAGKAETPKARVIILGPADPVAGPSRQTAVRPGDRAVYHRDLTIPDKSTIPANKEFVKAWDLQNGELSWTGWSLVCVASHNISVAERYVIPNIPAGKRFRLEIDGKALSPGDATADFEYRNEKSQPPFRGGYPLTIRAKAK